MASDRISWAFEQLDVQPEDRLLELGCGHGVALSLVAQQLGGGCIIGIDRSAKMAAAARVRNRELIAGGRVNVQEAPLHEADLPDRSFDKVFGIHFPPLLRGDGRLELEVIRQALRPGGRLYMFDMPFDSPDASLESLRARLESKGFATERTAEAPVGERTAICLVARPANVPDAPPIAGYAGRSTCSS